MSSRGTIHPADFASISLRTQGHALQLLLCYLKNEKNFHFQSKWSQDEEGEKKQPKIKAFKPNEITGNLTAQSSHQPHSMQLNVTTDFRIRERKGKSQSEM